jgi:integrase
VSAHGDENGEDIALPGEPYSEGAYERSHEAAVIRIGLEHRKYLGTTTHGLRHLYGQTLANLGVPPQVIKKGMHHRNYLSQVPYTVPDNAKTNEQLRLAQEMIASGKTRAIAPIASSTAEALLKISEFVSGGGFGGRY